VTIRCAHGCTNVFATLNELHEHHVQTHERPLPERYGMALPPLPGKGDNFDHMPYADVRRNGTSP